MENDELEDCLQDALSKVPGEPESKDEEPASNETATQPTEKGDDWVKRLSVDEEEPESTGEQAANSSLPAGLKGKDWINEISKEEDTSEEISNAGNAQTGVKATSADWVNQDLDGSEEKPPAIQGAIKQPVEPAGQVKKKAPGSGSRGSLAARLLTAVRFFLKLPFKIVFSICALFWRVPRYAYRRYRRISSRMVRYSIPVIVILLTGAGAFFLGPVIKQKIWPQMAGVVWSESDGEVPLEPELEVPPVPMGEDPSLPKGVVRPVLEGEDCEFLARPAAKLFIDGKLASQEVPPIYRTRLIPGEHTIRFVSPGNRTREIRITVVKDEPTRWFMNFVESRVDQQSLNSDK